MSKGRIHLVLLAVIIVSAFIVRLQVMDIPLERDEGEYAYAAQLMLEGTPPFKEAYNMKFPGIYAAYAAVLLVFGQTHWGVHLALAFVNAASIILVFFIGKRLFDASAGLSSALLFAMLSFLPSVQGIMANSEHFVLLFALGGILLLLKAKEAASLPKLFLAGVLLGAGYTIKQHGIAFILFGYFLLALYFLKGAGLKTKVSRLSVFTAGAAAPFIMMCAALIAAGVFDEFWFWTFSYAREYVSVMPFSTGIGLLRTTAEDIFLSAPLLWISSATGLLALIWDKEARKAWPFMAGLFAFSVLAVVPGFFFRPHYFIYMLPATALLFGAATKLMPLIFRKKGAYSVAVLCVALSVYFLYSQRGPLTSKPDELSRQMYGFNPFPEARVIADYIERNTTEDDRIAVLGSEPEIYFYSKRKAATGFIYTYALMERQRFASRMQRQMMDEVRGANPSYLVFVDVKFSWGANEDSSLEIFDWLREFAASNYTLVGMADLKASEERKYSWGSDMERAPAPEPGYGIYVYKRN